MGLVQQQSWEDLSGLTGPRSRIAGAAGTPTPRTSRRRTPGRIGSGGCGRRPAVFLPLLLVSALTLAAGCGTTPTSDLDGGGLKIGQTGYLDGARLPDTVYLCTEMALVEDLLVQNPHDPKHRRLAEAGQLVATPPRTRVRVLDFESAAKKPNSYIVFLELLDGPQARKRGYIQSDHYHPGELPAGPK
jgi:hypothetical protein